MHLNFKTRLSLSHALWVTLILGVAALVSDWALARLVREQLDHALITLAQKELVSIARSPDEPLRIHEAPVRKSRPSFERLDRFVQIVALDGEPVARSATLGTARLPLSDAAKEHIGRGSGLYETIEDFGEEPIRMVSVPLVIGSARYAVQVAGSLDDARGVVRAARWLFLIIAVAILSAVVATGALLARRALVPIDRIVRQARRIGEYGITERLTHPGTHDEMGRLVETLNNMLKRIELSFEIQRHFTADASHELMSPLSRLRAELEVTLRRPREAAEYEEALRSCLEEVERLCWLSEELLGLARLDAGEGRQAATEAVPLLPIVETVLRRIEGEARRRHVNITLESPAPVAVKATTSIVSVVLTNLLENAVKFCGSGGRVRVTVGMDSRQAIVAVSDTGPGVLPADVPLIFERFHRGTAARMKETPGAGLGLAICRSLIAAQGGQISVASTPGEGATFTIRLPSAE